MRNILAIFISSILFGFGLEVSQMTNPVKVIGFLDLFGNWQPSLILVMVGGIIINAIFFYFTKKKGKPIFADKFFLPTNKHLDKKLIIGAILFGIGWGVGGFCPGTTVASLFRMQKEIIIVFISMMIGMKSYSLIFK